MTQSFNELDSVTYRGKERGYLRPGLQGAIMLVLDSDNHVYEVEFFDDNGKELPTTSVAGGELELRKSS